MTDAPGRPGSDLLTRYAPAAVALLMVVFFAQSYFSSQQKSITWDEPHSIAGGYAILAWDDYDVYLQSPPLLQVLHGWGLYRAGPSEPTDEGWRSDPNPKVALGIGLLFGGGVDHDRIALLARLPMMLLGALLVGMIYAWGRHLVGSPAALAAALLAAFSPNLIGHSRVAAADLGCTFFVFASVATFWWAMQKGDLKRWLACGAVTGLALISKFTAMVLGPIYIFLVGTAWLTRPESRTVKWVAKAALPITSMCWLVIALAYGFDLDLSLYREGVARIYTDLSPDRYNYLLGVASQTPFAYYNVVAYLLKVPTAVLLLLLLAAAGWIGRLRAARSAAVDSESSSPGLVDVESVLFILIPAAAVIAVSFFDKTNIGLRRILPAFPFLLLFAGGAVRHATSKAARAGVAGLLVLSVAAGVSIYPHHLTFFNAVSGGPDRGPYLLDDSNVDWGQNLPALAAWQADRPDDEELRFKYFGTAPPPAYGVRAIPFNDAEMARPRPGVYAMSAHHLVGFRKLMVHGVLGIDWLTAFEPTERIAHSIYIYELEESDLEWLYGPQDGR